jgi:hypothetical protein
MRKHPLNEQRKNIIVQHKSVFNEYYHPEPLPTTNPQSRSSSQRNNAQDSSNWNLMGTVAIGAGLLGVSALGLAVVSPPIAIGLLAYGAVVAGGVIAIPLCINSMNSERSQ